MSGPATTSASDVIPSSDEACRTIPQVQSSYKPSGEIIQIAPYDNVYAVGDPDSSVIVVCTCFRPLYNSLDNTIRASHRLRGRCSGLSLSSDALGSGSAGSRM